MAEYRSGADTMVSSQRRHAGGRESQSVCYRPEGSIAERLGSAPL